MCHMTVTLNYKYTLNKNSFFLKEKKNEVADHPWVMVFFNLK
jgi:hypothetical protein